MPSYETKLGDISQMSKNIKILFISTELNRVYTKAHEDMTEKFLKENGFENIDKILVPGAFEIPGILVRCIEADKYDLVYIFAVIIYEEIDQYNFIVQETARGIMDTTLKYDTPVVFGVLNYNSIQQVEKHITQDLAVSGLNLLSVYKKL